MARPQNEPDPLEARRRKLAEQERMIAERMARVKEEIHQSATPAPVESKPTEPPVWRLEEDVIPRRPAEPTTARKRNLARQRQRDMILFFIFIAVFVAVLVFVVWVAYVRNVAPNNGA